VSWSEIWNGSVFLWSQLRLEVDQQENFTVFRKTYTPASYAEFLASKKIGVVVEGDPSYPSLLKQLPVKDRPLVLFVLGSCNFWDEIPVAVVGTRRPSVYGEFVTEKLTRELVFSGATIISGFMYGVDLLAHQSAVRWGGKSVGVLGFGFDHCRRYPQRSARFVDEFLANGNVLVSEFTPEVEPSPGNFPVRNRIVAGLSHVVVVTEAAAKSGSLITAERAAEYNRIVCAVPGLITSPMSDGTRALINQGAKLVGSGAEILAELEWLSVKVKKAFPSSQKVFNTLEQNMCDQLRSQPLSVDDLSRILQKPINEISATLTLLELKKMIRRDGWRWLFVGQIPL